MALSSQEIVAVWEAAAANHPLDRGLALLATALPDAGHDGLAALPVGQRDALMLALRRETFGDRLPLLSTCPSCDEHIELELSCRDLLRATEAPAADDELTLTVEGVSLRLHRPDSYDIAAIARLGDEAEAYETLLARCVIEARDANGVVAPADLTGTVREAIAEALLAADPGAELLVALNCPACGATWEAFIEINASMWDEVASSARRLLVEVHQLARAYGWRESDTLALSPVRRAAYLEMTAQ